MSAIAEWYLLPSNRVSERLAAAQKMTKGSWWRAPKRDPAAFWACLDSVATKGPGLQASGWVMNPLLEYLAEKWNVPVRAAENHPLVPQLGMTSLLIIEGVSAQPWLRGVEASLQDAPGLSEYLRQWYGEYEPSAEAGEDDAHVAALQYLHDGLSRLLTDAVLLLFIG